MSAGEGKLVELFGCQPTTGDIGRGRDDFGTPCLHRDAIAGDGVFDDVKWFGGADAEIAWLIGRVSPLRTVAGLKSSEALRATRSTSIRSNFDTWEFPEVGVHDSIRALADEEFTVALDDEGEEAALGGGGAPVEVRELVLEIFFLSHAEFVDGASGAVRRTWRADKCPEFHQGLVEVRAGVGGARLLASRPGLA